MVSLLDIRRSYKGTIKVSEPLSIYASLGIGGAADYVFAPSSADDLVNVVMHLRESAIPFLFAGRGSNLLVSDHGYHGAIIVLEPGVSSIRMEPSHPGKALVHAAAGARVTALVDFCIAHSLQGVETLAGVSSSIGGLVTGNGAGAGELARGRLAALQLLRDSEVLVVTEAPEGFPYRRNGAGRDVVLGATFRLERGEKEQLMRVRRETLVRRNAEQPLNVANAALMFRDPEGKKAAELVSKAGMKGFRRGDAVVSERHANMLLNAGNATVADALTVIKQTQRAVREKTGVGLALAIRLVGFEEESMREVA
jgi:UDP-N-acetylmuramate dehydrogenase